MPFDPFADGSATATPSPGSFDPFADGSATATPSPESFDPFKDKTAAEDNSFDPFAAGSAQETPDSIKSRLYAPGSTEQATIDDARILRQHAASTSPLDTAKAFGAGVWDTLKGVKSQHDAAVQKENELQQNGDDPFSLKTFSRLGLSMAHAGGQTAYQLGDAARRVYRNAQLHIAEHNDSYTDADRDQIYLTKLNEDLENSRRTQDITQGKESAIPGLAPPENPAMASVFSNVVNPAPIGVAGRFARIGGEVAPIAERSLGSAALKAGGQALESTSKVVGKVAGAPLTAVEKAANLVPEEAGRGGATAALMSAVQHVVPGVPGALAATKAGASAASKVGEATRHLADSSLNSESGIFEQMARNENAPNWMRSFSRRVLSYADVPIKEGADLVVSGAHGAAFQGGLAALGGDDQDDVARAAGSGFALGGLTHLALRPGASEALRTQAQNYDVARWFGRRTPEEQQAIKGWSRDQMLAAATAEYSANGISKEPNVKFTYLPAAEYAARFGATRGVTTESTEGQPLSVFINADAAKGRTMYHELFHVLQAANVEGTPDLLGRIIPIVGADGKTVLRPGLVSPDEFVRRTDEYLSHLPAEQRNKVPGAQEFYDQAGVGMGGAPSRFAAMPDALKARIGGEMGAELMANAGTEGALKSPWQRFTHWMATKELGKATPRESSDLFKGLQSTPEINAALRNILRNRERTNGRLEFDEQKAKENGVFIPREALMKKGAGPMIDEWGDNDIFRKDPTSVRPDKVSLSPDGTPILLSEGEVKRVQAARADAMVGKLAAVPDTGDPHAVRQRDNGTWAGRYFTEEQVKALESLPDHIFTPSMKTKLRQLNDIATQRGQGVLLHYNAALGKNKRYSSGIGESVRVGIPYEFNITKASNFIAKTLDVTALHAKLNRWFSKRPQFFSDFNGLTDFRSKLVDYLSNHENGRPGETGLDSDPSKAIRMKNAINDFLNMHNQSTEGANPSRVSTRADKDFLLRDRRFDRINKIEKAQVDNLPLNYDLVSRNFSPSPRKERRIPLTPKMWIDPAGKPLDTKGSWHAAYLHQNAEMVKKQYGFDPKKYPLSEGEEGPRLPALNQGFARVAYEQNSGTLTVELARAGFNKGMKDGIFNLFADNAGKIDNMRVHLLNRDGSVASSDFARLFNYSDREKLNHIPMITEEKSSNGDQYSPVPSDDIRKVSDDYAAERIPGYAPHQDYHVVNEDLSKRLADAYESAQHNPKDPAVEKAYRALSEETRDQWDAMHKAGYTAEPWTKEGQPYTNSKEMAEDIKNNKHLWFFPTKGGFGASEGPADHPLLAPSGVSVSGHSLVVNDLFRAIHDFYGHAKEGYEFGPRGEYNAYLSHKQMFGPEARAALASETLAQNSWVNYGKHLRDAEGNVPKKGEPGYTAPQDRPFAEQKAALLPHALTEEAGKLRPVETKFIGRQEGYGKIPGYDLHNLVHDVPGVSVKDSTIAEPTLRKAGLIPSGDHFSPEPALDDKEVDRYAKRILSLHNADPESRGSTFNLAKGRSLGGKQVYIASIYPDRSLVLDHAPSQDDVAGFIRQNQEILSNPENSVGTWEDKDSGKTYLDVSVATPDKKFAEFLGKKFNQISVWDSENKAAIPTGGNGEPVADLGSPETRVAQTAQEFKRTSPLPTTDRSAVSIIKDPAPLSKDKYGRVGTYAVAKYLSRLVRDKFGAVTKMTADAARETGHALATEAAHAIGLDNSAIGWYDRKVKEAIQHISTLHPELKNEPDKLGFYKALIAITSNGQTPEANLFRADSLYTGWKDTGEIETTSKFGGKNKKGINSALTLLQRLVKERGLDGAREFLERPMTVRELKALGYAEGLQEKQSSQVKGSMVFGPKIGAFFSNLNGDWSPVTVDRWFIRTIARIRGDLTKLDTKGLAREIPGILNELSGRRKDLQLGIDLGPVRKDGYRILRELKKGTLDEDALQDQKNSPFADYVDARFRAFDKSRFLDRSALNMGVKRAQEAIFQMQEAPFNASERDWIRESVSYAQAELKAKGIDITNADMQAVLWFFEKDLYAKLGVRNKKQDRTDYAVAAKKLLDSRGGNPSNAGAGSGVGMGGAKGVGSGGGEANAGAGGSANAEASGSH